jgi:rhodanese-related sulfurtransferase
MFTTIPKKVTLIALSLVTLVIGVGFALSIDTLRYTPYIEPKMNGMEPRDVYATVSAQNPEEYLFFDVRSQNEYDKLHAEFAENKPIATLFDLWRELPRGSDKKIYLICSGGRLAGVAYGFLQLHGFRNIVHVTGGIQNWTAQNQPTVISSLFPEGQ